MSDSLLVKSRLKDYSVKFTEHFASALSSHLTDGAFLVCDANVFQLYQKDLEAVVSPERLLLIEPSESNKSLEKCQALIELGGRLDSIRVVSVSVVVPLLGESPTGIETPGDDPCDESRGLAGPGAGLEGDGSVEPGLRDPARLGVADVRLGL